MSSSDRDAFGLDQATRDEAYRIAAAGLSFKLDPATTGALAKIAAAPPMMTNFHSGLAKQLAPSLAAFNQNSYKWEALGPELTRTIATLPGLNFSTAQFATLPGFKALIETTWTLPRFDCLGVTQMQDTLDAIRKAANITSAVQMPAALTLATAAASMAKMPDMTAVMKPLMDQIRADLTQNYNISEAFTAANASALLSASQALAGINESIKLKQSLMTSELAQTIFASSQAIRSVDALTLSKINLAAAYAARVTTILDEDEGLADVAEAIERRFVDRFKMSREAAHNAVHVLVWMALFSAIVCGVVFGPTAVALVIGAVCSATGRLNADSVSRAAANKFVPIDKTKVVEG